MTKTENENNNESSLLAGLAFLLLLCFQMWSNVSAQSVHMFVKADSALSPSLLQLGFCCWLLATGETHQYDQQLHNRCQVSTKLLLHDGQLAIQCSRQIINEVTGLPICPSYML